MKLFEDFGTELHTTVPGQSLDGGYWDFVPPEARG